MAVSYKKLFKLLIDRDMKKKELKELSGIGNSTMTKLANNENVTVEVMIMLEVEDQQDNLIRFFQSSIGCNRSIGLFLLR